MPLPNTKSARKNKKQRKPKVKINVKSNSKAMVHTPRYKNWGAMGKELVGVFGMPAIGKTVGHLISRITGHGDYRESPFPVKSNVLVNSHEIPKFSSSSAANVVTHREYIADVVTSGSANTFSNTTFALNPGQPGTFPWLSTIAQNYEEFRIHGMLFEFKSTSSDALNSTNTALGEVIMATNYNPAAPSFTSKMAMENSEYAQSAKPSVNQVHAIECDPKQTPMFMAYVRTGTVPTGQDVRFFDMGNFNIATNGFQGTSVNVGELWVTYLVEFFKPVLPATIGGTVDSYHALRTVVTNAGPFGTMTAKSTGNISVSFTTTALTVSAYPGNQYLITLFWMGGSAAVSVPVFTYTSGCTQLTYLGVNATPDSTGYQQSPPNGTTSTALSFQTVVTATANTFVITLGGAGTLPTSTNGLEVFITTIDNTITG
jgi:hypothetical protein